MLINIKQHVVIFCLLHICLCVYASQEYFYVADSAPADLQLAVDEENNIDKAALGAKKDASASSVNKGDGSPSYAASSQRSGRDGIQMDGSSGGITGLTVHTQYIIIAVVCSVVALVGIVIAVSCWCRLHNRSKGDINSSSGNYSGYGVTGPTSNTLYFHESGDRKLAQSAQMYHYQHQKQQMIDMEKANGDARTDATDEESEADNDNDTYTVYEAPGLAQSGNIEVHNPLFKAPTEDTNGNGKVND